MILRSLAAALLGAALLAAPAQAEKLANKLFGAHVAPSNQKPMPIGSYARGCAAGLVELPQTGPTWQAMRLSRNRNYGQPEMIRFLVDLSETAAALGWGKGLYIGDISQPRGGPMTSGHASHQIGLDADIWWLAPKRLDLSAKERENISSIPMRSADQLSVTASWGPRARALLKAAASDPRVDRVFVAAAIKIEICKTATRADKKWLQKVRPIAGHDTHFHVRLKCPKGARLCETQKPTVAELSKGGDGCDETLTWWVTDYLNPPKPTKKKKKTDEDAPRKKGPREFTLADLPKQCRDVLASD
ncbi:penicillin-insensitive murein endopeptidase [Rhodobacter sp. SGA-6-6]|uniref:penicillin-insensitive murein endopeptidase n=1 Tax=Rhodobacter sp. SGA-6-6 TaxID=2710882 RepID=UPI0013EAD1E3|nr:penicillin-insensitive murein endopeptidase [Rhodobacter sp. SGA-6-6]NGM44266.1 penicillin-insensitive murein endopeptidase [Rhodobacter sp. SGA-6-6]